MPLGVDGSHLVRLSFGGFFFFGFVFFFPNNELIFVIRLFASSNFYTCAWKGCFVFHVLTDFSTEGEVVTYLTLFAT